MKFTKLTKVGIIATFLALPILGCGSEKPETKDGGTSAAPKVVDVKDKNDFLHGLKKIKIYGPLIDDEAETGIKGEALLQGLLNAFKKLGVEAESFDLKASDNPDQERFFFLEVSTMGGQKARGVYFYHVNLSYTENALIPRGDVMGRIPIDVSDFYAKGTLGASELGRLQSDIMMSVAKTVKDAISSGKQIK